MGLNRITRHTVAERLIKEERLDNELGDLVCYLIVMDMEVILMWPEVLM